MDKSLLFWAKAAAIGQIAGAIATFLAVGVSLWLALRARKPRIKFSVGERLIISTTPDNDMSVLVFSFANLGERVVHVKNVGWRTGWLSWGPSFLKRKLAVQLVGSVGLGHEVPFEILPGADASCYSLMENLKQYARERTKEPFFTRNWPIIGRRATSVWGWMSTAEGYTFYVRLEKSARDTFASAEIEGGKSSVSEDAGP